MKHILIVAGLLLLAAPGIGQQEEQPYFSLSAGRTYASGATPAISLTAWNVQSLEFRVYRVNDTVKFFEQLEDPHRFAGDVPRPRGAGQRTLLEIVRSWKRSLRASIRRELRAQFTEPPHEHIPVLTSSAPSQATKEVRFVEAPMLNSQQLVMSFQHPVLAKERWNTEQVEINVKDPGVYLVEAARGGLQAYTIVTVSDLVLTAKTARGKVLAFVTDRMTGAAIEGADVWMLAPFSEKNSERVQVKTGADGLAELPIAETRPEDIRLVARRGADTGVVALASYAFGVNEDDWTGYIYTDRPVYRPGHTVHFKGIFRMLGTDGYRLPDDKGVNIRIQNAAGQDVFQQLLALNGNGTLHDQLVLPADAPLGYYSIEARMGDRFTSGSFQVEEYKKPEYEVRVTAASRRVLQGARNNVTIDSRYYFGEPVAGAAVKYSVYRSRYWFPLWYDPEDEPEEGDFEGYDGEEIAQGEGVLGEDGKLTVPIATAVTSDAIDVAYRVEARVTDPQRREIVGSGSFVATYGSFALNIVPESYVQTPGSRAGLTFEARNYDSEPVRTPVRIELMRWDWRDNKASTVLASVDASTNANGSGRAEVSIPNEGGSYRARITARTPEGRTVEDWVYLWVSGAGDWYTSGGQSVEIVPDKKTYAPGDTAKILVASGQPGTPVLVSVEGRDLKLHRVLQSDGPSVTFELPITERDAPGLYVSAQYTRDGEMYRGTKYVRVPPEQHKLNIEVTTDKPQYRPGETAVYNVKVTDVNGKPVRNTELSLGVVDEAIYAIRRDTATDPLRVFYGRQWNEVFTSDSMSYYFSGDAGKRRLQLAQLRPATKLAQLKPEAPMQPKVRKAFPDTAYWIADLTTDGEGRAVARVELPDSLTTWRATARGVTADTKVGATTVKNITRKNVMLRLGVPRFFTRGDEVTISTLVHNYLDTGINAQVSLEVSGLEVVDGAARSVAVPSRGETRVDWRVRATQIGVAKITAKALAREESDALELEIPVNSPGVPLSISKGGSLNGGASGSLDLTFPERLEPGSRRLSLRVSPSIAGALFGAVEYLTSFPYGCVEQTMSSFLPNIIVQKTVADLGLKVELDRAALNEKITDGLDRLYAFQHEDGGWGWWETDESHPFMTAYVVAGLQQAGDNGMSIRYDKLDRGYGWMLDYLGRERPAADLHAYMVFALGRRAGAEHLEAAYRERGRMSPYGLALLGLALEAKGDGRVGEIAGALERAATQTDTEVSWRAERDEMLDFSVDATPEATAYAVRFLSHQRPQSPLLPKAALWLMNHRNEGYWWSSTKQTAMVIYGLTDYMKVTKELTPDLTVRVTVNGKEVLSRKYDTATGINEPDLVIPESALPANSANRIEITTSGTGRAYYSARAEYSSSERRLERQGTVSLNILRDYFRLSPVQSGGRITYDLSPLDGAVASGDVIAVRLTVTGSEWRYLMVEDPIPAGTEFIERDQSYELRNKPPWWGYYFTRRERHDDRMAIFETYFPQGQQDYFYLLKVVNPGTFTVSPARVQPMYQPGVMATTGSRQLEAR